MYTVHACLVDSVACVGEFRTERWLNNYNDNNNISIRKQLVTMHYDNNSTLVCNL